jgi:hypothetical protein
MEAEVDQKFKGPIALTIFLGAFLLFQVQPLIASYIVPWFGGSGAVWTTAMLFFQLLLVAGYAYAHWSSRMPPRAQVALHGVLLLLALTLLPITPSAAWKPIDVDDPTWRILALLAASVGFPFLVLASTSPLLQSWIHRLDSSKAPYRLYALGNAGSLLALISYPFLIEPFLSRTGRVTLWSWSFALFAVTSAVCAGMVWRSTNSPGSLTEPSDSTAQDTGDPSPPSTRVRILWLVLPANASLLMLAVTNQISQDVAAVPFLWVISMSIYLFSFILVFERDRWYRRPVFLGALVPALLGALWLMHEGGTVPFSGQILGWSSVLMVCCTVCHGELARLKPHPSRLTGYYLMISVGGAAGGVFAALLAPKLFDLFLELHVGLWLSTVLAIAALAIDPSRPLRDRRSRWVWVPMVAASLGIAVGLGLDIQRLRLAVIESARSFHGVSRVVRHATEKEILAVGLLHGRTTHGLQWREPSRRRTALLYYSLDSGAGIAFRYQDSVRARKVGVIGLGSGALATYARAGDLIRFYEIDAEVARIANSHFTFLTDTAARVEILLGDARIALEREAPQGFDLLFVDAFSSDSIPVHLLTREAFEIYDRQLDHNGVLAVHISSAHLDLEPPVRRLAEHLQMHALRIDSGEDGARGIAKAAWMLLSRDERWLKKVSNLAHPSIATWGAPTGPLWTDDFANILGVLKFTRD